MKLDRTLIRQEQRLGVLFGLLGGLALALAGYGRDANLLAQAGVMLPWWRLAIGGLACLSAGTLAGGLAARIDNSLAALILWVLAGGSMVWLMGRLPYTGQSMLVGWLDPRFQGLEVYPITQAARVRAILAMIAAGGLAGLGGALQLSYHDWFRGAGSWIGQFLVVVLWLPFFVVGAIGADAEIHRPLREPVLAVDRLLRFARQAQTSPVDPQVALDEHLGAVGPIEEWLPRPWRLMIGGYDSFSMAAFSVEIDFEGSWARCFVVSGQPTFCQRTENQYQEGLACWLAAEDPQATRCPLTLSTQARTWLQDQRSALGPQPTVRVAGVQGEVTLLEVTGQGLQAECRARGVQPARLEVCQ